MFFNRKENCYNPKSAEISIRDRFVINLLRESFSSSGESFSSSGEVFSSSETMPTFPDVTSSPSTKQPPLPPKGLLKMYFGDRSFDLYDPFGYEDVRDYFDAESSFMAANGYSQILKNERTRQVALHLIIQIMTRVEIDAFVSYLAMCYFDWISSKDGLIDQKGSLIEDVEFMVFGCISIALKKTLSLNSWSPDFKAEAKKLNVEMEIRQFLANRSSNIKYLRGWDLKAAVKVEDMLGGLIKTNPVTPFCFIKYYLTVLKADCEVEGGKECITKIILDLQDDIRLCEYKPSFVSAAAVLAYMFNKYPDCADKSEEKVKSLDCIKDKESFSQCLVVVKEIFAKKAIASDPYKGGHLKLNWKIDDDIEETIRSLDYLARISAQIRVSDIQMRQQAELIRGFAEEVLFLGKEGKRPEDEKELKEVKAMIKTWVSHFESMTSHIVKMIKSREPRLGRFEGQE
ncbi:unnamed protein product [Arabis nemorensis]|uniref:Cyclin N-terminal domain-containing protein n=1 Tax=Arabis nemorensis TaxID=586526 RepID=A0A565BGE0_9BRAS|nr:unnamed protein product [Arabis nemorensis]